MMDVKTSLKQTDPDALKRLETLRKRVETESSYRQDAIGRVKRKGKGTRTS